MISTLQFCVTNAVGSAPLPGSRKETGYGDRSGEIGRVFLCPLLHWNFILDIH